MSRARRAAGLRLAAGRVTTAAVVAITASACYRYVPIERSAPVLPGARVRVELNEAGTIAVAAAAGPSVVAIEGMMDDWRADSAVLSVRSARTRTGERFAWTGLRVAVPVASIERIERREFSRSRSVMLGAGAAAAAGLVIKVAIDAAAGGTPGGGGPPPPQP